MSESFDSWCILELMGHVRMAGRVTEEERFGCKMGRIDVPTEEVIEGVSTFVTVYFGGSSVYRMTPVSEEAARAAARRTQPEPVHQWELPKPKETEVAQPYSDSFTRQFDDLNDPDDSSGMEF